MEEAIFNPRVGVFLLGLAAILLFLPSAFAAPTSVFTRYNIHAQEKVSRNGDHFYNASYANYTNPGAGHLIIPAGAEITILKRKRKGFRFRVESDNKVVDFDFHKPRMGMSLDEYLDKVTSLEPVSYDGLSELDKKGIADGKAYKGMSREGVMIALGYPATHRTPSLDATSWTYWTNRFGTIVVDFDAQGVATGVRD